MTSLEQLKREFDAEDGTFLLNIRAKLKWDWNEFRSLTSAMYDVAEESCGSSELKRWVSEGFWFCDRFIPDWTSHPCFPRPDEGEYNAAIELIHDLAYFYFREDSPYIGDTLRQKAKGLGPGQPPSKPK